MKRSILGWNKWSNWGFKCPTNKAVVPSVITAVISDITTSSAISGGDVTSDGGSPITERGICYSLNPNPTINDTKIIALGTIGAFISNLSDLTLGTSYNIRAYAINSVGVAYGENILFQTLIGSSNVKYGRLYNWYAANNALFTPVGWHVPTTDELETLLGNVINDYGLYASLFEEGNEYWDINQTGDNFSGFSARGNGQRNIYSIGNDGFYGIKQFATIMSISTNSGHNLSLLLVADDESPAVNASSFFIGTAIRLIKDNNTLVDGIKDYDDNVYNAIKIGDQVWLQQNWACTKLRDGTPIANITDGATWDALTTGAYCAYDNDESNVFL
jgi:uncharacterized protein (TIGR02145 family)